MAGNSRDHGTHGVQLVREDPRDEETETVGLPVVTAVRDVDAAFPSDVLDDDISGDWASAIAIALINKASPMARVRPR